MSVAYRRASREAAKANQIRIFLEDTLSSVTPNKDGSPVTVRRTLDEAVHWVGLVLSEQPEVEASLRVTIGNSYRVLTELDLAEEQLSRALEIRREFFGSAHPETGDSMNALGLLRRDQGRMEEAESLMRGALEIRERNWGPDSDRITNQLLNLASVARETQGYEEAQALIERALEIRMRVHGELHSSTAMCHYRLARLLEGHEPSAAALHDLLAMESRVAALPPGHPDLMRSVETLGRTSAHADPALKARVDSALRTVEGRGDP